MAKLADAPSSLTLTSQEWVHILVALDKHLAHCDDMAVKATNTESRYFWEQKSADISAVLEKVQKRDYS
jgi:hypothetical protein